MNKRVKTDGKWFTMVYLYNTNTPRLTWDIPHYRWTSPGGSPETSWRRGGRLCSVALAAGRSHHASAERATHSHKLSYWQLNVCQCDSVNELLTHIRAQSMSIAACVTPLLFLLSALTVFTPSFSLNLKHSHEMSIITKENHYRKQLKIIEIIILAWINEKY